MDARTIEVSLILAAAAVAYACANEARTPESTTTTTSASRIHSTIASPISSNPVNVSDNVAGLEMPQSMSPNPPPMVVAIGTTDTQILAFVAAMNASEIEQGRLALRRAVDQHVREYAQTMVDQHGDAKLKQQMLMSAMNMSAEPTPDSSELQGQERSSLAALESAIGTDFDKAYIELQIREHRQFVGLLDTKLIPAAQSTEIKRMLLDMRPRVAEYLQSAEDRQQILAHQ